MTEKQLAAHTENLSLFGCFVETLAPFPAGTKVRLRISHSGANLTAQGTVAYARNNGGMGIAFTSIEPSSVSILDAWLTGLEKVTRFQSNGRCADELSEVCRFEQS